MSFDELVAEVKKLSLEDRASLAKWIVESLDELSESEIEALWVQEAERRLDELEQGRRPRYRPKKCFAEPGPPFRETHHVPS